MALRNAKWNEVPGAVGSGLTHIVTGAGNMLDAIRRDLSDSRKPREKAAFELGCAVALASLG